MLRINLQANAFHVWDGPAKSPLVIGRDIVLLGDPAVRLGGAGLADHREDVDQRNGAGTLSQALGRVRIPYIRQDPAIRESDQHLGRLIVCRATAEVAALRQSRDLPLPR